MTVEGPKVACYTSLWFYDTMRYWYYTDRVIVLQVP